MDTLVAAEVALVILFLAFSAFFSGSETAYSSLSKTRLKNMIREGEEAERAGRALSNCENFDRFLTTILVGNNIANIASSTIMTAVLSDAYGAEAGVVLATVLMITVLLLVGEITPKSIAKKNPERFAIRVAAPVHWAMAALAPISWVFMRISNGISRLLGAEKSEPMSEAELSVMIDEVQKQGTLEKSEGDLVKSALEFDDIRVSEICIPRVDIAAVPVDVSVEDMKRAFMETEYSRIPVYEGTVDRIVGAVFVKDFFMRYVSGGEFAVSGIVRPVKFVAETSSIADVMRSLQKAKLQLAVVLDSTGGTVGIVTLEDILEELVGEIWDESDTVRYPVIRNKDGTYAVIGDANIYDVMGTIGQDFTDEDFEDPKISSYIMYKLGAIPKVGDEVPVGNVRIKVKTVRNRRVREVEFSVVEPKAGGKDR